MSHILNKKSQTALIHAPRKAPQYISSVQPPLFRASTIIFENTDALFNRHWTDPYDYSYGTHGTPTAPTTPTARFAAKAARPLTWARGRARPIA